LPKPFAEGQSADEGLTGRPRRPFPACVQLVMWNTKIDPRRAAEPRWERVLSEL
jgi:hypothetical protein